MFYTLLHTDKQSDARRGILKLPHGEIQTPQFMPVGTHATVKALTPADLVNLGASIILGNTFHLYLRPGHKIIGKLGGLHKFMGWNRPILTDSGGYQIFSLARLLNISDEGLDFRSPVDGSRHFLTPEDAMEIQHVLGSDIAMILDECTAYPASYEKAEHSVELTARWARRCRERWLEYETENLLFGIVQGSIYSDLRRKAAEQMVDIGFDGYALGGLSVGETKDEMVSAIEATTPYLPVNSVRYLMGVGTPEDLLMAVSRGIDIFDCVMPTRHARNGSLFTSSGPINIKNARYIEDEQPLDSDCSCYTCQNFPRGYLSHLYRAREILSSQLNTIHNIHFYLDLMKKIRQSIERDFFHEFSKNFLQKYHSAS